METTQISTEQSITTISPSSQEIYNQAADLLVNHNKTSGEVIEALVKTGAERGQATVAVFEMEAQIADAKNSRAKKDVLYGALWCGGGIIFTVADTGFIFWGAIVFGGIQLVRGLMNLQ
jgi:hypothetical protein